MSKLQRLLDSDARSHTVTQLGERIKVQVFCAKSGDGEAFWADENPAAYKALTGIDLATPETKPAKKSK